MECLSKAARNIGRPTKYNKEPIMKIGSLFSKQGDFQTKVITDKVGHETHTPSDKVRVSPNDNDRSPESQQVQSSK